MSLSNIKNEFKQHLKKVKKNLNQFKIERENLSKKIEKLEREERVTLQEDKELIKLIDEIEEISQELF